MHCRPQTALCCNELLTVRITYDFRNTVFLIILFFGRWGVGGANPTIALSGRVIILGRKVLIVTSFQPPILVHI